MLHLSIKYFRLVLIAILFGSFAILTSQIYFLVTNSSLLDIFPEEQTIIGFENDDLPLLDYNFTGIGEWTVTDTNSYLGEFSIQSPQIQNEEVTAFNLSLDVLDRGLLMFNYKVESEYSTSGDEFYDGLELYINGELIDRFQPETDGDSEWEYFSYQLEVGPTVITWQYIKDVGEGDTFDEDFCDCAFIDNISLPQSTISDEFDFNPTYQDVSSGLYSAFIHPENNQYVHMKAKGGTLADFDLDGDQDLYFGYVIGHYFENEDGYFTDKTMDYEIDNSGSRGVVVGDIDNNGYPDILKWRYLFSTSAEHYALMNQGNHYYNTVEYLDPEHMRYMHSQGFMDVDLDGDLDIVAVEKQGDTQFYCYKLHSGLNDLEGPNYQLAYSYSRFDENSSSRTLAIADFDNDGDQDVYIPRKEGSNWLFENQTLTRNGDEIIYNPDPNPLFIEAAVMYGVDDSDIIPEGSTGYGAAWGDYDNDADMDLYLSNWGRNRLYRNDNGTFTNTAVELELQSDSLSNGAGWGDFNNDGYFDIWAANFKREDDVFLNSGNDEPWDNSYRPIFASATQDVVPVDYDKDGWLDMFTPGLQMAHGHGPTEAAFKYTSLLYKNITTDSTTSTNNWVFITLEGAKISINDTGWTTKANKSAIGARVIVHVQGQTILREVIAGKGHGSMDPLQLHFGLGDAITIDQIDIYWPSVDTLTQSTKLTTIEGPVQVNEWYRIVEEIGFVGQKGDVNHDDEVDVLDIVSLVNEILHSQFNYEGADFWAADTDFNEQLNVLDVIKMVSFALTH
jgi:hypothetical protein